MKNITYYLFVFCLFFAPLAFGTVEPWSLAALELSTGLAFVAYFGMVWSSREQTVKVIGILPLSLLIIFIFLQLVPLPQAVVKVISPETHEIYAPVINTFDESKWIPISVDRKATLHELLRLVSYGLMYILAIQLLRNPKRLKRVVTLVVFLGAFVAVLALVQNFTLTNKIYWFRTVPIYASPFGPWVNPNQFAGYIELVSPLALAMFLFYRPRVRGDETWRERFVAFFSTPTIHFHFFLGFAAVVTALSIFVSLCRGGMLSVFIAGFMFLFLYNLKFPKRGRGTLLFFILCLWGALSWFGWDTIGSTFTHSFDDAGHLTDGRITLWTDVVEIIKDYPLVGTGFGTFLSIYPLYKTINDQLIYDHAHNDYLELLTDGGIIGFLLAGWFVLTILFHGWKMIRLRNDHYSILLGIGSMAGILAILCHSVTDFNLHNGAVGLYFFFVCGLLVSGVNARFGYYSRGTLLPKNPISANIVFAVVGIVVLPLTVVIQLGSFWAAYQYNSVKSTYISTHLAREKLVSMIENLSSAVWTDPLDGFYYHKLGSLQWYLGEKEKAVVSHAAAGFCQPMDGAFLQQLGLLVKDEDRSKVLIEGGFKRAINKKDLALNYAEWLFWKSRREEALGVLSHYLSADIDALESWMPLLGAYDLTIHEYEQILPKSPSGWIHFGRYCELNRSEKEADHFFSGAIALMSDAEDVDPQWFRSVIHYYQRQKQYDMALLYTRRAVEVVPQYPEFHLVLGDHYLQEGISYRAKEEYEQVLVLDPGNREARKRLRKMGYDDAY